MFKFHNQCLLPDQGKYSFCHAILYPNPVVIAILLLKCLQVKRTMYVHIEVYTFELLIQNLEFRWRAQYKAHKALHALKL